MQRVRQVLEHVWAQGRASEKPFSGNTRWNGTVNCCAAASADLWVFSLNLCVRNRTTEDASAGTRSNPEDRSTQTLEMRVILAPVEPSAPNKNRFLPPAFLWKCACISDLTTRWNSWTGVLLLLLLLRVLVVGVVVLVVGAASGVWERKTF